MALTADCATPTGLWSFTLCVIGVVLNEWCVCVCVSISLGIPTSSILSSPALADHRAVENRLMQSHLQFSLSLPSSIVSITLVSRRLSGVLV